MHFHHSEPSPSTSHSMHTCETSDKISRLLSFLPLFDPPQDPVLRWKVGLFPCPVYNEFVEDFFEAVGEFCGEQIIWDHESIRSSLYQDSLVEVASLTTLREMLAYCLRGEKFYDGHWAKMITEGRITVIMRRMAELCPD